MHKRNVLKFLDKYFDPSLDLRVQTFHLLAFVGMAAGVAAALVSFTTGITANGFVNLAMSGLALLFVHRARKKNNYRFYYRLTVILVFMLAFPYMFFKGGGYHSSMPCFFVFALVFTALMLEKADRAAAIAAEFIIYTGACLIACFRPDTVEFLATEMDLAIEIIIGLIVSSTLLLMVILLYIRIYDNRQERLNELDKLKTEFLQNISHELRTPLSNMCNYALDTLRELGRDQLDVPEMEYDQNRIRAEGERLIRMVNQLLDVTAIEAGRQKTQKEPLSLASLLLLVADMNKEKLDENGNRTILEIPVDLPDIAADRDDIERVLSNLISNAARHTKEGIITLSLSAVNGWQEIRVSDTGEGMPPQVRSQVFLKYIERESKITGRSGMGLYICKKLIDAHGGEIGIESERGKSTVVWFRLPANE